MILHHTADEVKRFNWFKWLVLLLLFIIFIILLLSGNPGEETAVSDTPAADTTEQVEESMPELAAP
ncbi:MAG: hypothetical protein KC421_05940, partial [Anaerolineales bacterium]|nr:hypothetical protein [Anaerolineales bacterium]